MIEIPYSLIIEANDEADSFGFYSPELEGLSGIGHSMEDCLYQAKWGMKEHLELLTERNLPIPPRNDSSTILTQNVASQPARQKASPL
jgi:predicted RNase H-like HicB family nuclease